jgi:hypothetical protein
MPHDRVLSNNIALYNKWSRSQPIPRGRHYPTKLEVTSLAGTKTNEPVRNSNAFTKLPAIRDMIRIAITVQ